jgi:hypothetical protein
MLYIYGPSFAGLVLMVLVYLFIGKMHFLDRRDGLWLDFLAGIAVAYVFVDILPHLAGKQEKFAKLTGELGFGFLYHHVYLLALAGFLIFLGVILSHERWRLSSTGAEVTWSSAPLAIKTEVIGLALYSAIVGYMLAEQPTHRVEPSLVFATAMAAHFTGLAHLSHHRYPKLYDGSERYLLVISLLAGWILGLLFEFSGLVYAGMFAFLAGGITIVTMIFELPRMTSGGRYRAFCIGAIAFALVMVALESVKATG